MDTLSAAEAARRLDTSVPRVQRAIGRLGLDGVRGRGGRVRLTERQLEELRLELGVVPRVEGLSRVETRVLAALARAPRGLISVRAVARRAGVSPTAAGAAVRSLSRRGLVRKEREWVASGQARELELIHAEVTAADWPELAPQLAAVALPAGPAEPRPARLPSRLAHLFWNADIGRIDVRTQGGYLAERLLSTQDLDGLAWGRQALTRADWEQAARTRGLTAREQALAHNLARSAPV
jgi:Mn-dependent DtxR family transcriptional regulator